MTEADTIENAKAEAASARLVAEKALVERDVARRQAASSHEREHTQRFVIENQAKEIAALHAEIAALKAAAP